MEIRIINVRGMTPRPDVTYVGREFGGWPGSPLANPYAMSKGYSRNGSVQLFRGLLWVEYHKFLRPRWDEIDRLSKLLVVNGSLTLGCWCYPARCHAEVIRSAIQWRLESEVRSS